MKNSITKAVTALPLVFALGIVVPTGALAQETTANAEAQAQAQATFDLQAVIDYAGERAAEAVAEFQAAGYRVVDMSRTLLGRIRITLENEMHVRQIVVSRSTGEIMYDAVIASNEGNGTSANVQSNTSVNIGIGQSGNGGSAGGSVGVSVGVGLGN